jgi:PadR family transcriptional regulator, regulatory protein PadR
MGVAMIGRHGPAGNDTGLALAISGSHHPSKSEGKAMDTDGGLLRGTLDVLILKALTWGPRHGYAVAEWIRVVTDAGLLVEEGPLYTALHRLEKRGWIVGEWGYSENNRRARYYQLSRAGRKQLEDEMRAWDRYARAVEKALGATSPLPA